MAAPSGLDAAAARHVRRSLAGAAGKRLSVAGRRLSSNDQRFLQLCLMGLHDDDFCDDSDFFSARSSEGWNSLPGSTKSSSSRGSCLRVCLGADSDGEDCAEDALDDEDLCNFKLFSDGESDADDRDGEELEDLFSFDMDRVADAVRRGANAEELQEIIEEALGDALESRLADAPDSPNSSTAASEGNPLARGLLSGSSTPSMTGNLSGRMTPAAASGPVTPQCAAFGEPPQPPQDGRKVSVLDRVKAIETRVHQVLGDEDGRRQSTARLSVANRRLSVMQHPKIAEAVSACAAQRRQSLARACRQSLAQVAEEAPPSQRRASVAAASALRKSLAAACRNHRRSLLVAAEVLEAAGVGVGQGEGAAAPKEEEVGAGPPPAAEAAEAAEADDVGRQLGVVQEAMEAAVRRHRKSVACAVREAARAKEAAPPHELLPIQSACQEKVHKIIARAYAQREQRSAERAQRGKGKVAADGGCPLALMHMRLVSDDYKVHCGPAKGITSAPPARPCRQRSAWGSA